ncbi:hypothetical protein HanIR_Chr13g0663281 [Helianthus annuus]|nr:hypothetical protein HanIR_Chr13g0663281 [Helianthus annuus]
MKLKTRSDEHRFEETLTKGNQPEPVLMFITGLIGCSWLLKSINKSKLLGCSV